MQRSIEPLESRKLTWAVLLGRWVDFARAAVGLPDDEAGRRTRESVADIVTLQAVRFALDELDELDDEQQAIGLDRAGILVERAIEALERRWEGAAMPGTLIELMDDAQEALAHAAAAFGRGRGDSLSSSDPPFDADADDDPAAAGL